MSLVQRHVIKIITISAPKHMNIDKGITAYIYRCTVHSVVHLINTPTNAHVFIYMIWNSH